MLEEWSELNVRGGKGFLITDRPGNWVRIFKNADQRKTMEKIHFLRKIKVDQEAHWNMKDIYFWKLRGIYEVGRSSFELKLFHQHPPLNFFLSQIYGVRRLICFFHMAMPSASISKALTSFISVSTVFLQVVFGCPRGRLAVHSSSRILPSDSS